MQYQRRRSKGKASEGDKERKERRENIRECECVVELRGKSTSWFPRIVSEKINEGTVYPTVHLGERKGEICDRWLPHSISHS